MFKFGVFLFFAAWIIVATNLWGIGAFISSLMGAMLGAIIFDRD